MKQASNRLPLARIIRPSYVILVFLIIFFNKNILCTNGNFIGGDDISKYFFWHAHFVKEQLSSGNIPLWNPYYYCGHPFLANPETFVFYPSTLLFVALPLSWAFNIDTLLHLYLAAMGVYFFVFIITRSKGGSLAGATIYSFSGYFLDNIYAGHIPILHTAALMPWIFYFVEKAYKTERKVFFIIAGVVFSLQILSGNPQNNYYTAVFVVLYCLIRYFFVSRSIEHKPFHRFGIYFPLILVVAFGISAIQILPSLEFMSLCDRADNTYEFVTFASYPPTNFFRFLVPIVAKPGLRFLSLNWEFSGYIGILSIVLAGIGAVLSKHRRYTWCLLVMLLIAVTMMLGRHTFFYRLYYKFLPGISTFRIPARAIIILVFSASVLAGFGVQRLCESKLTTRQNDVVTIVLIIMLLCILSGNQIFLVSFTSREMLLAVGLTISAFVVLNLIRFIKNPHLVAGLLIAVLFADFHLIFSFQTPKKNQNYLLRHRGYEIQFERDAGFYRVNTPGTSAYRGIGLHYYNINAYAPIVLNDYFDFVHEMAGLPKPVFKRHTLNPELFREDLVFSSKILCAKYALVRSKGGNKLIAASGVMPHAVLVRDAISLPKLEDHLKYMKREDFEPQRQVLLVGAATNHVSSVSKADDMSGRNDFVTVVGYYPKRIELKSASDSDRYLVLSELFYPGWHAYVDGKEVPILRADFLLRAIPLTAGKHDIVFVYRPMSFLAGAAVSLLTLSVLACIYLVYYRKISLRS